MLNAPATHGTVPTRRDARGLLGARRVLHQVRGAASIAPSLEAAHALRTWTWRERPTLRTPRFAGSSSDELDILRSLSTLSNSGQADASRPADAAKLPLGTNRPDCTISSMFMSDNRENVPQQHSSSCLEPSQRGAIAGDAEEMRRNDQNNQSRLDGQSVESLEDQLASVSPNRCGLVHRPLRMVASLTQPPHADACAPSKSVLPATPPNPPPNAVGRMQEGGRCVAPVLRRPLAQRMPAATMEE